MNITPATNTHATWSRILIPVGGLAMLVGAIDPMEGSLLILPGSGLVALGTFRLPEQCYAAPASSLSMRGTNQT